MYGMDYDHGPVTHRPEVIPSPPAGTGFTYVVSGTGPERIAVVSFLYTAAGGGGVRTPFVELQDQTSRVVARFSSGFTVASGSASFLTFAINIAQAGAASAAVINAPLPEIRLERGMKVVANASAIGAADTMTLCGVFVERYAIRPDYDVDDRLEAEAKARAESLIPSGI